MRGTVASTVRDKSGHAREDEWIMLETSFLNGIARLVGSFGVIAFIVTAFSLMLGFLKPADAFKRVGAIVGTVIALLELPQIVIYAWSAIPWWQRLALVAVGVVVICALVPRRQRRHRTSA